MTQPSPKTGQICWYEVPVVSAKRAAEFYTSVLGWEVELEGHPSPFDYTVHMFRNGDLCGAFLQMPNADAIAKVADPKSPQKSGPITTFMVDNIDHALKKIEDAGGKCHIPRTEIGGGMGFFARFIDTEGNLQGIWAKE